MIGPADVARIAEEVAREQLGTENVVRTSAEPMIDWTGAEGWRVLIVLAPAAVERISGDATLDNLSLLQERLQEAGEQRFGFVEYATEEELAEEGADPEC
jgi:hypothetical protein